MDSSDVPISIGFGQEKDASNSAATGCPYDSSQESTIPSTSAIEGRSVQLLSNRTFTPYSLVARIARVSLAVFIILLSIPALLIPILFKETRTTLSSLFNKGATTFQKPIKLPSQESTTAEFEQTTLSLLPKVGSSFTLPFANIDTTDLAKAPTIERIQKSLSAIIKDCGLNRTLPVTIDGINIRDLLTDLLIKEPSEIATGSFPITEERFKQLKIYDKACEICGSDDLKKIADFLDQLNQNIFAQLTNSLWACFTGFEGFQTTSKHIISSLTESKPFHENLPKSIVMHLSPFVIDQATTSQRVDSKSSTYQMSVDATYNRDVEEQPYPTLADVALRITVACNMNTNKGEITFTRIAKTT